MRFVFFFWLISGAFWESFSQADDTLFIKFNDEYKEMKKEKYKFSDNSPYSYGYFVRQREKNTYGDIYFIFSHPQRDDKHNEYFNNRNPTILKKKISYLKHKKVMDVNFFRTNPYVKINKIFEQNNNQDQNPIIFMMDLDEIKNDSILLREVRFSRPVKE
jgi:hypothetical protein